MKNYFGKYIYVITPRQKGIVDLDKFSARDVLEDVGWMRDYKIFEVMEAKGKIVFHLDYHLERLTSSLTKASLFSAFQTEIYCKSPFLEKIIAEILELNNFPASLVWIYVTGGLTYDGFSAYALPNLYILTSPFSRPLLKKGEGRRLKTVYCQRHNPLIKNTDYFNAERLLSYDISTLGYDDILYSDGSQLLETSRANFFIVINGTIFTARDYVLEGITRKIVLDLAHKNHIAIGLGPIKFRNLEAAEEAFITSTTKGVWPVIAVDEKRFEVGPITLKLREMFNNYRNNYFKNHQK